MMAHPKSSNLQAVLQNRLARFRRRLQRLQADASNDNVHDFRIACREWLACYGLLKEVAPAKRWKPFVQDALEALDPLRDLQQMQERLSQLGSIPSTLLASALESPLQKASARWHAYAPQLQSPGFVLALAASEKALLPIHDVSQPLQAAWQAQWQKALRRCQQALLQADAEDLKSLHRLRIRYKKLRYLLELRLESSNDVKNNISVSKEQLKQWQEMLGEVEDFRIMARLAKKYGFPDTLSRQFLQQASQHAQQCSAHKDQLAQFLMRLDLQVKNHPEENP